jgi:HD-GYP domain-containing protein (c-di-GMP phosphodiesterase class II)
VATNAATAAAPATAHPDADGLIEEGRTRISRALRGRDFWISAGSGGGFLATAVALALYLPSDRQPSLGLVILLVAAYALASRVQFEIGFGFAIPTQLVFVPMLFVVPPGWAPLLVAAGFALGNLPSHLWGAWHPDRLLVHLSSAWHAVGPALVLGLAGEPSPDWRLHWPLFVVAIASQFAFDYGSAALRALPSGVPARAFARAVRWPMLVDACLSPLGLVIALAATQRQYAFLLSLPLLGLVAFFARERRARVDHALELSHAYRGTALLLGDVVEADDAYTGSHSRDVVDLVLAVSDRLGLSASDRRDAEFAAMLHDIGKIRIPSEIINKPGPLDMAERALIETHTIQGEQMLTKVGGLLGDIGNIVRSCHERWDGAGYPDRLSGQEIPLIARIVCACDAFSAMTTDRPYRKARPVAEALGELHDCAGTQFDPAVVSALLDVVGLPLLSRAA